MKFGFMTQLQIPRPWTETSERNAFWNGLDQGVAAEAAGFEYYWITEQHFFIEIGHSPASDMYLAALSQRTTTLRLALGVVLMPIHNPVSIAERVATLDVLSNGRVEFGTGRGTSGYIAEGMGLDPSESREVAQEHLDAVLKMFDADYFEGYQGKHVNLPPRHMVPRHIQRPHPPLWTAASNLETYEHAASQGFGVVGVTRSSIPDVKAAVAKYHATVKATDSANFIARKPNHKTAVFGIGYCDKDDQVGRDVGCAAARWYYGDNDAELNPVRFATAGGVEKVKARMSGLSNDDLIDNGMAIGGDPDTFCRTVENWASTGIDQMIFMIQAGDTTHDQVMRSIDLIGEKVIPRFQD